MRAVTYSETGHSSVLRLVDRDRPEPGEGEVRVRLVRAGVNPTDWKFRANGMNGPYDEVAPGQDGAGVIDAVGPGVAGFAEGDRVWVLLAQSGRWLGTAAEHTVQPVERVVHLPVGASYDLGASLGVPAVTAHRALTAGEDVTRLSPGAMSGMTVLVAGGAGAVGNAAIQLARWAGATVLTTISSDEKAALAVAAGAHQSVNYRVGDPVEAIRTLCPEGVDLVVEVALAQNLALDVEVLRNRGTIAYYADNGGSEATVPVRGTFAKNLRLQGLLLYTLGADLLEAATLDVNAAVSNGALRVGDDAGVPLHHFPLEDLAGAHDAVEQGAVGKVLVDVSEE
ncbi:NADPH:quinone reductase [Nocardioides lianchengensis]|uniref:NADPH2:quinone reductase n=1 Tax=Nocardioides lianchengensis TaxID=1045774 RepID=A0A1G6S5F5_9ACTN|nr:NADPH:quinone reductase [Nocardioides lianchengensis]NYG09713.1 NADPH2:quinone reductase [Nocardioides lianchengensis]SDD11923.1 NADPH2:quinone reductase [Nocardioides lianchengensis]